MSPSERVEPPATARDLAASLKDPKFSSLALSSAGLVVLWFVPAAVWGAMPVWLAVVAALYRRARSDDWLALPVAGLPFWWATGLAQYTTPVFAVIAVIGAVRSAPLRGRVSLLWEDLGAEKWLSLAAFAGMLPSFFVITGAGRIFTWLRTVGLVGSALAMLLVASAYARRHDSRRLVQLLVAFAGVFGLWTLAQLVYKGSIHLPLQRTASLLDALPGKAGELASRGVREAAGIKYENIGGGRLVVRPHAFFIHAVVTGAMACLLGPLLWRRIRLRPVAAAVVAAGFATLLGVALVASLARGAYLGIAIALPVFVVVFWPDLRRVGWRSLAPGVAIGVGIAAVVLLTRGSEAKARQESSLAEGSFVSRAAYYRATLHAIPEYPLFGHGTQRDNAAAPLQVPKRTKIDPMPAGTLDQVWSDGSGGHEVVRTFPDGTQMGIHVDRTRHVRDRVAKAPPGTYDAPPGAWSERVDADVEEAVVSNGDKGIILVRRYLQSGRQDRIYLSNEAAQQARLISTPDRDPPLGSHSTLLGIGYKYGILGLGAFVALWLFLGIAPLRRLRGGTGPMFDDARAIWVGVLAFGAQFLIYEYDFDSASPVLFYLLGGILLGLSAAPSRVELNPEEESAPAHAGRT